MTIDASTSRLPVQAVDRGDGFIRDALFLATFLLVWVTASPFPDLADPKVLDPTGDGNMLGQALTLLLTAALGAFVLIKDARLALKAMTPVLVLTVFWFALSAAASAHADLAARRLVLSVFILLQATVFLLLPRDRDHFARLLAVGAMIVLVLCYAGVLFAPEHSIHQSFDIAEPELAGNWRGLFTHKNGAGAAMAILVFIGIFIARTFNVAIGAIIIALATIFLLFTESKSPIRLLPLVLVISYLITRARAPAVKLMLAAGVPIIIGILTIGSVTLAPVETLVGSLLSDPTFTGRNDIWRFAVDHIAQRPLLGFGFQAFWGTSELVQAWTYLESWGYRASDAHSGYLNLAVMTGIVGVVLALLWIFVQPFRDYVRTPPERSDAPLTMLFLQIWLLGLCEAGFESVFFDGGNCLWFMMVVAIIGLRFQATAQLAR
jgi:O-antigen ligase